MTRRVTRRGLKWTRKTLRKVSRNLTRRGYRVGPDTVKTFVGQRNYALRVNGKRLTAP